MEKLTDLEFVELRKTSLHRTMNEIQESASSILLLNLQWKDIENDLDSIQSSIKEQHNELILKEEEFALKEKAFEKRCGEIESEKKDLELRCKDLEASEKQCEQQCQEVKLMKKLVNDQLERLESKEKYLDECLREYELKEEQFGLKEKSFENRLMEFELNEKAFRERCMDLEFNVKRYEEKYKRLEAEEKCVQNQLEEIKAKEEEFGQKERDFELRYRELEAIEKHYDERLRKVELREKEIEQQSSELELNVKKYEHRLKDLESKEKKLAERSEELEMKKSLASSLHSQVKTEAASILSVKYSVDHSSRAHLRFCVNMDGKELQMVLNERLKQHGSLGTEVAIALQLSTDPAKLVLDAIEGFYPPHLSKGDKEFEGNSAKISCILLLEQLMELSPEIKHHVRKKAMKVAFDWLTKMRVESGHEFEVLGFLWLLASFQLANAFDADELLNFLVFVAELVQNPKLYKALALEDKITRFKIKIMPQKRQREFIATEIAGDVPIRATTTVSSKKMACYHLKGS